MPVRRDVSAGVTLGEEAVFAVLDVVSASVVDFACEGIDVFGKEDLHNSDLVFIR